MRAQMKCNKWSASQNRPMQTENEKKNANYVIVHVNRVAYALRILFGHFQRTRKVNRRALIF